MTSPKPVKPPQNSAAVGDETATMSLANHSVETSRSGSPSNPAAASSADSGLPRAFGRYRLEKELGKGAMGVVYLAADTALGRNVALKKMLRNGGDDTDALERFLREARSAANLRHPNICPVYDVGEIDGERYITMAYIPGKTLDRFIHKSKLPPARQVALLFRKIALALDEAHRHDIIHRDLKPSNIMLDDRNEPMVMDFGLARNLNTAEQGRLTQSGAILGTPAYMAPEQVAPELGASGPQSDVYSLGVILYEFLTGERPFSGAIGTMFVQIVSKQPARPSELKPDVDPTLEAVCLKMMAKDAAQRFAGMKAVAAALGEFLKTGKVAGLEPADPDVVPPAPEPIRIEKPAAARPSNRPAEAPPRRWLLPLAGIAALGIAALLAVLIVPAIRPSHPDEGSAGSPSDPPENTPEPKSIPSEPAENPGNGSVDKAVVGAGIPEGRALPAGPWVDVLSLVKPPKHAFTGEWERSGTDLVCAPGPFARCLVPAALSGSYELEFEFTRKSGDGEISLALPVGTHNGAIVLGGDSGAAHALQTISDGNRDLAGASFQPGALPNGARHVLQLDVALNGNDAAIVAKLNDEPILNWTGASSRLSLDSNRLFPNPHCVGLLAHESELEIHGLRFRLKEGGAAYRLRDEDWRTPLFSVASAPAASVVDQCLDWNGRWYWFSDRPVTLPEARQLARNLNGRLLTISSKDEEDFLTERKPTASFWMSGWCDGQRTTDWLDERHRPLPWIGEWHGNEPSSEAGEQYLAFSAAPATRGWHDSGPDSRHYAGIEWGEEPAAAKSAPPVTTPPLKPDVSEELANPSFADGLKGWTMAGRAQEFLTYQKDGQPMLTTFGTRREATTGRLSQQFRVPRDADELTFFVHGGSNPLVYVALRQDAEIRARISGRDENESFEVAWSLREFRGELVTLEIVDNTGGPWGFIGVSGFRITSGETSSGDDDPADSVPAPSGKLPETVQRQWDKERADYHAKLAAHQQALLKEFDKQLRTLQDELKKRVRSAKKKGGVQDQLQATIDVIKAERIRFESGGLIPLSLVMNKHGLAYVDSLKKEFDNVATYCDKVCLTLEKSGNKPAEDRLRHELRALPVVVSRWDCELSLDGQKRSLRIDLCSDYSARNPVKFDGVETFLWGYDYNGMYVRHQVDSSRFRRRSSSSRPAPAAAQPYTDQWKFQTDGRRIHADSDWTSNYESRQID